MGGAEAMERSLVMEVRPSHSEDWICHLFLWGEEAERNSFKLLARNGEKAIRKIYPSGGCFMDTI